MVRNYMKRLRSTIVAVVSAKSDFALQDITELAKAIDPKRMRTLGLITKPDTLDSGSDSESAYFKLAQNKDVELRLGWHVLKNRSYNEREYTSAQRDKAEEHFFSKGIWASLDPAYFGVKSLKSRLSDVLKSHILRELPSLLKNFEIEILDCQTHLRRFGTPRASLEE
jgi:hypothetical protein